tara:strand:+ start:81 stop:293 length:213 start_codon:yes stop_codon:yes gene_type:complete
MWVIEVITRLKAECFDSPVIHNTFRHTVRSNRRGVVKAFKLMYSIFPDDRSPGVRKFLAFIKIVNDVKAA